MVHHNSEPSLVVEVKSKQHLDPSFMELKESVLGKLSESFSIGGWCFEIPKEVVCAQFMVLVIQFIDSTKMYHDLREAFWWDVFKRDVTEFVAKCPNCQQVEAEAE